MKIALRVAALSLALVIGTAANAQTVTPEHLAAAREVLTASRVTRSMDDILPGMGEEAKRNRVANRPDAADQISAIIDEVTLELAARRAALEEEVAKTYASIFSVEELKTIAEFYKTPAGLKLMDQTPVLARAMTEAAQIWGSGVQRDLNAAVDEKLAAAGLN